MSKVSAFRRSGRFSVIVVTPESLSSRKNDAGGLTTTPPSLRSRRRRLRRRARGLRRATLADTARPCAQTTPAHAPALPKTIHAAHEPRHPRHLFRPAASRTHHREHALERPFELLGELVG